MDSSKFSSSSSSPQDSASEATRRLENVLGSLDVSLEEELSRYRRQRRGGSRPRRRSAPHKQPDLIAVGATAAQKPTPPPPPPNPFLKQKPDDLDELSAAVLSDDGAGTDAPLVSPQDVAPENYLESSEALLRSLDDGEAETPDVAESVEPPADVRPKSKRLLKLAVLLLLILGGIGAGFAWIYRSQIRDALAAWNTRSAPAPAEVDDEAPVEPAPEAETYDPPGPDLSTREFVELDLESLSTLELENGSRSELPPPAESTPEAAPAQSAPPPATGEAAGSNFYVVIADGGPAALAQARTVVPDAFVRNFSSGSRIQLAVFDNQAQAEEQINALRQRGLAVQLFGPTNE